MEEMAAALTDFLNSAPRPSPQTPSSPTTESQSPPRKRSRQISRVIAGIPPAVRRRSGTESRNWRRKTIQGQAISDLGRGRPRGRTLRGCIRTLRTSPHSIATPKGTVRRPNGHVSSRGNPSCGGIRCWMVDLQEHRSTKRRLACHHNWGWCWGENPGNPPNLHPRAERTTTSCPIRDQTNDLLEKT